MTVQTEAQLKTLLDQLIPSSNPEEYVKVADMRQLLLNVFASYSNSTDDGASETVPGIVELATDAETITGTDTARAVTPANVQAKVASATAKGIVELATTAEVNTGTDANRVVTPDDLAASYAGTVIVVLQVFAAATDVATGDGKLYYHVPAALNGMDIVSVHALNSVAGVTGQCDVQIANVTGAGDVCSTVMSIDTTEVGSDTGATPAVIDVAQDDLVTNDILRIDVDAIHSGTAPKGLTVTIECRLP